MNGYKFPGMRLTGNGIIQSEPAASKCLKRKAPGEYYQAPVDAGREFKTSIATKVAEQRERLVACQLENQLLHDRLAESNSKLTESKQKVARLTTLLRRHAAAALSRHSTVQQPVRPTMASGPQSSNSSPPQTGTELDFPQSNCDLILGAEHPRRRHSSEEASVTERLAPCQLENQLLRDRLAESNSELTASNQEVARLTTLLRRLAAAALSRHSTVQQPVRPTTASGPQSSNSSPPQTEMCCDALILDAEHPRRRHSSWHEREGIIQSEPAASNRMNRQAPCEQLSSLDCPDWQSFFDTNMDTNMDTNLEEFFRVH